jgi:hypothetical protein
VSATDPHQVFHRTIEAVWRIESARVIAGLTRDLDLAEDRSAHFLKNECLTGLTPILSQNDRCSIYPLCGCGKQTTWAGPAVAQQERITLSERTKAGLQRAKRAGRTLGRRALSADLARVERFRAEGLGLRAIATKLSVNTLQKARVEADIGRGTRSSTLLVRVEDVVLRLHGRMARVSAV